MTFWVIIIRSDRIPSVVSVNKPLEGDDISKRNYSGGMVEFQVALGHLNLHFGSSKNGK